MSICTYNNKDLFVGTGCPKKVCLGKGRPQGHKVRRDTYKMIFLIYGSIKLNIEVFSGLL